jgi:hypothetical protein
VDELEGLKSQVMKQLIQRIVGMDTSELVRAAFSLEGDRSEPVTRLFLHSRIGRHVEVGADGVWQAGELRYEREFDLWWVDYMVDGIGWSRSFSVSEVAHIVNFWNTVRLKSADKEAERANL